MTAPAKVLDLDELETPAEPDAEGATSVVVRRARLQPVCFEGAGVSERARAEALTLAARAGRWDVVAQLAAVPRFKP